jgi:hypothetical protein
MITVQDSGSATQVRRRSCARQDGAIVFVVAACVAVVCVLVAAVIIWKMAARQMLAVHVPPTAVEHDGSPAFVKAWSVPLSPPFVLEMALVPGQPGQFFALHNDQVHRIDGTGKQRETFAAPPKSSRIATDRTGAVPYLLVVSRKTKWTGAINYVVTTDHFLHALDTRGRGVWTKRFDPKELSTLEPLTARIDGRPAIVLSASKRILCVDLNGGPLWELDFWHHPDTVAVADLNGDGHGDLLAAQAPKREIVRINGRGRAAGKWGEGDGPRRLRTSYSRSTGFSAISLRQVFGRGPGVQHALTFFDAGGTTIREVELPADASPLSHAPITAMDVDGTGNKAWVVALGDGSIRVFSPFGERLAEYQMDMRPRTYLAVPQLSGADLLVTATDRGLTAWRPIAARMVGR